MAYTKTTWVSGGAPGISAEKLNQVELGIKEAHNTIDVHVGATGSAHGGVTSSANGFMISSDKAKIDLIEAEATADQTASEILTALKTVDTDTSGLNANTLQGKMANQFMQSTSDVFVTGTYTGDDTSSQDIMLGFTPSLVLVADRYGKMGQYTRISGGMISPSNIANTSSVGIVITNGFRVYYNSSSNYVNEAGFSPRPYIAFK